MNLTRRDALLTLAGAASLVATPRGRAELSSLKEETSPTSGGSIRHSVCRWCYAKIPLEDLAVAAREMGLSSIELLDPEEWPVVQKHGLTCAMSKSVMTIPEGLNRIENHAKFVPAMIERIEACAAAAIPNVICFSGNRRGLDDEVGLANCAVGLKQIVGAAEKRGVTVCMELLNSRINHKDYMCDHTAWGVELVKRVGSERFRLLYDIYHMQIMEGDIIRTIQDNHSFIAHFHTGGVPGRHEIDGTQELNYGAIMRAIKATGFAGFVAQEFVPTGDPLTSLRAAVAICSV